MAMFRETLWFKRGDLEDEQPPLPIEDRYLDDGEVTAVDTLEYGVHSGHTRRLPVDLGRPSSETRRLPVDWIPPAQAFDPQVDPSLIREMKAGRWMPVAIGASILAVGVVLISLF
jgi:hypothetical protein